MTAEGPKVVVEYDGHHRVELKISDATNTALKRYFALLDEDAPDEELVAVLQEADEDDLSHLHAMIANALAVDEEEVAHD